VFAHSAFLYDLVAISKPGIIVELGTSDGESYFALCQSILEQRLDCVCYAILASESCAAQTNLENPAEYASYSHLLAAGTPADGFAELEFLHLTNFAVEKLGAWIDRVRPGGFVLFSGIDRRDEGSRTRLCWEQIAGGDRFAFHEGAGLGVWRKGGGSDGNDSPLLSAMFDGCSEAQEYVRRHYMIYNGYLRSTLARTRTEFKIAELSKEVQASRHELMALEMELKQAQFERNEARREIKRLESLLPVLGERDQLQEEVTRLSALLQSERKTLRGLTQSLSWRVTRPIRRLSEMARGYK